MEKVMTSLLCVFYINFKSSIGCNKYSQQDGGRSSHFIVLPLTKY